MRSDCESNFNGAVKELRKSFQDMSDSRINRYLQMHGADWITWINNPWWQVTQEESGRDRSELPEVF